MLPFPISGSYPVAFLLISSERKASKLVRSSRFFVAFVAGVFCLSFFLSASAFAAEAGALKVGAAKVDTTPANLAGLTNLWRKQFAGVHDHLYARALVLDNGMNTAAIVATDLVEFGDTTPLRERIAKETGVPADHLILTASHDHSAPRGGVVSPGAQAQVGGSGTAAYSAWLYDKIVEAVKQAKAAEQPARIGIATGKSDVNTNRDEYYASNEGNAYGTKGWGLGINYDRPSDKTVWVVKFETLNGDPIAILFDYAVHSVVAGPENDQVTGDLAGAAERYVEAHYKDKVVALYTIGPAGDQNPKFIGPGQQPEEAAPIYQAVDAEGFMLGAEVVRVAVRLKDMTDKARIGAAERVISCPARPRDPMPGQNPQQGAPGQGLQQGPPPQAAQQPSDLKIHLGLIEINNIAITGVSGEVVTNIYYHLRQASPLTNTFLITMSNDRIGYIIDDAAYDTPIFERSGSPLARGCAENGIVNNLVEMIRQNE